MVTDTRASELGSDRNRRSVPRRQLAVVLSVLAALFAVLVPLHVAGAAALAPSAPDGLTAEPTSPTQVHLVWNAVSDATSYTVSRSTTDGLGYVALVTPTITTTSLDDNVNADTAYYYVVQAATDEETSPNSGQAAALTGAVTGLQVAPRINDTAVLQWDPSPLTATVWELQRSVNASGPFAGIASPVTPTFQDTELDAATTYFYRVRATTPWTSLFSSTVSAISALDHLALTPATVTLTSGDSQAYTAEGFDALDQTLGDVTAATTFTVTPNGSCTDAVCMAPLAGDHTVTGTKDAKTGTAAMTVNAGAFDHLVVSPANETIASGATQAYTAQGFDAANNDLGDMTAATTFTIAPDGSCTDAVCTATLTGAHIVTGTKDAKTGTADLSVIAGALDHLVVAPATATIASGATQAYTAEGFDAADNSLGDVTPGTTFTIAPDGSCTAATCTATLGGPHTVTGTSSDKSDIADLTVSPPVQLPGGRYQTLAPVRILNTRNGVGAPIAPIGAGQAFDLPVTGAGGVPATGVSAVVLNVTATQPTSNSWLTNYPTGGTVPNTAALTYRPGQTVSNLVVAKVGTNGKTSLRNASGSVHLIVEVLGWYSDGTGAQPAGGRYAPLAPVRILNTRNGVGAPINPLPAGQAFDLPVTGAGGVPATGVSAVVLNVTATQPTSNSWLTNYPTGGTVPNTAALTYGPGQTVSNLVIAKVGTNGKTSLRNASGSVHLIVEVLGWYSDGTGVEPTGGLYSALDPVRLLNTRNGIGGPATPIGPGQTVNLPVTGVGGVPATGVSAVVLTVTATQPTGNSWLTNYPTGGTVPNTAALTYRPGQTVSNLVIAKVGTDGKTSLRNASGSVHLIVEVLGWYSS